MEHFSAASLEQAARELSESSGALSLVDCVSHAYTLVATLCAHLEELTAEVKKAGERVAKAGGPTRGGVGRALNRHGRVSANRCGPPKRRPALVLALPAGRA